MTRWPDERIDQAMSTVLRTGVVLAAAVVLVGGVLYLAQEGGTVPRYRAFRGEPSELRTVHGIVHDALALRARGIIQLGLLLLIATPVARVVFSLLAFAIQRDVTYVVVTSIVLSTLLYSLAGGTP